MNQRNFDQHTVASFGDEWSRHRQSDLDTAELERMFDDYFHIVPWDRLPQNPVAFDMGTGTGRWARLVAPRVDTLNVIDASEEALGVARGNLATCGNVRFHHATTDTVDLPPESFDFGYSLGVLHHIPDTRSALADCVRLLRPGGVFLVYLYYRFDNRPAWFRMIWRISDLLRRGIHRLPPGLKSLVTDLLAYTVYWPVARLSAVVEKLGLNPSVIPLSAYRDSSMTTMRTDSRDRFGTPLEQRFTRAEIEGMLRDAGLIEIRFSDRTPFWTAVGIKSPG